MISASGQRDFRTEQAYQAAQMLETNNRPEAVFVANDAMALVVMDVLRHQGGLRVPDDIGIVGYDDIPPAGWLSYQLTSYRQPADEMVSQTVHVLMSHIEQDEQRPNQVIVSARALKSETRHQ